MKLWIALCSFIYISCHVANSELLQYACKREKLNKIKQTNEITNYTDTEVVETAISSLFEAQSEASVNASYEWNYVSASNLTSIATSAILFVSNSPSNKTQSHIAEEEFIIPADEREAISILTRKLLQFSPHFDSARSPSVSINCRDHTKLYLNSIKKFELWALKMLDSSAHLTSGILNGNINQYGDFDQCLSIQGPGVQGQYCLAYMQPKVPETSRYLKNLQKLVQSHGAFKSDFNDPGHRVPRFSLINWALCVPSSCSAAEVEYSLKELIHNLTLGTGIQFQVRIEPRMCQSKVDKVLDTNTKLAGSFFLLIILFCIGSTLYECYTEETLRNDWLTTFSLYKNTKWLLNTESYADDIKTVHGIRFLNAAMLLLSHKSMAIFFNPYINRTYLSEALGKPWTVFGRAAAVYTEPFLLFSGMLTSYSLIGRLKKGQSIKLKSEYIGRLLRILPTLGALILFCTYILPLLGSGPQWNLVVRHHSDLCKQFWWRNLLFIQNYFGFSNMCLTHTHHLGIDTELFAFAPIAILCLWKWPRKGVIFLFAIVIISTGARFYTTVANKLSNYIYFGATIKMLFKTADHMYSYPPHRATVYIIGIILGYTLRMCKTLKLTDNQLRCGWCISTVCFFGTLFGPAPMGDLNYTYNPVHAAYYAAFAPIAWCTLFIWIVFTSHLGYQNGLCRFLSWKGFQITTKLSYAVYLTQFPVFFFNVGRKRSADYYSFVPVLFDTSEYLCILLASVALTLMFEAPFQNIKKLLFKTSHPSKLKSINHQAVQDQKCIIYSEKEIKNILD